MTRMTLQERRALLIDAAARVVARDGVHAATTRAIVAEADMPLASFHYAFESHSALMRQVMLKVVGNGLDVLGGVEAAPTLTGAIEIGLNSYLDSLRTRASEEQALLELFHYALRTPEHRGLATEAMEGTYAGLEEALVGFAQYRGFTYTVPARQIAMQLIAITDGLTMAVLISGDSDLLRASVPAFAAGFAGYVSA